MAYDWLELSKIGRDGDTYLLLPAQRHLQTETPGAPRASSNASKLSNLAVEDIYFIGACYALGICGKPLDIVKAMRYFKEAADAGMAGGQYMFAQLHLNDQNPFTDYKTGLKYMKMAANNGNIKAQSYCAHHYERGKNYNKAFIYYKKCADNDDPNAQYKVGYWYASGCGTDRDLDLSFDYIQKAADQGMAAAQNRIGVCYLYGYGIHTDPHNAIKAFTCAAEKNDRHALYNLGMLYQCGVVLNGTFILDPDLQKASHFFKQSAQLGYLPADQAYNDLYCYVPRPKTPPKPDLTDEFELLE